VAVSVADAHFTALVTARPSDLDQPVRQQLGVAATIARRRCIQAETMLPHDGHLVTHRKMGST
jgi:hypothetical protein